MLLKVKPEFASVGSNLFFQAYRPNKWKSEYPVIFKTTLELVDKTPERELLSLIADQFSPSSLRSQVLEGFRLLLKCEKKSAQKMTLEEIVDYITRSDYLLDQGISHLFYDRLHLLAALKSDETSFITTKTGKISLRDLMIAIITSFEKGVDETNAIAAEQFYLRLIQIYEKIHR
jgi:hypothetical protein